jgi:hypothetical protein
VPAHDLGIFVAAVWGCGFVNHQSFPEAVQRAHRPTGFLLEIHGGSTLCLNRAAPWRGKGGPINYQTGTAANQFPAALTRRSPSGQLP